MSCHKTYLYFSIFVEKETDKHFVFGSFKVQWLSEWWTLETEDTQKLIPLTEFLFTTKKVASNQYQMTRLPYIVYLKKNILNNLPIFKTDFICCHTGHCKTGATCNIIHDFVHKPRICLFAFVTQDWKITQVSWHDI